MTVECEVCDRTIGPDERIGYAYPEDPMEPVQPICPGCWPAEQ